MFAPEAQRDRKNRKIKIPGPVPSSLRPLRFTVTWVQDCWSRPTKNLCAANLIWAGIDFRQFNVPLLTKGIPRCVL
jgi:hypothetical protein